MIFSADFETTTNPLDCRVWAWGAVSVDSEEIFAYGNTIETFIEFSLSQKETPTLYFHNLKFDGDFIINWLFKNGYSHSTTKVLNDMEFSTLISSMGTFYAINICKVSGKHSVSCKILNSLNVLPFSVEQVAKSFGLPISKLKLDYDTFRPIGHIITPLELEYLKADCLIVAKALRILFDEGQIKMTTGSNALNDYKKIISKKRFSRLFPIPSYDNDVRQSYKGGWSYLNPKYKGKTVTDGIVFDVNSLYPSVMYYNKLPFGEPIAYNGKYETDKIYDLYIQMFSCSFKLKKNHLPTIQIKNNPSRFMDTEYLTTSGKETVTLCMTNVDIQLLFDHYHVTDTTYINGWKFKSSVGMFKNYVDKWNGVKIKASKEGNKGMRTLAKLMLNSLYGKFALNPRVESKVPYLENGRVKYTRTPPEEREPIYIPVGTFITAYAREKTIRSAQSLYKRFIYADTDSLHLLGKEIPTNLDISDTELGKWKLENRFTKGRFLRSKSYIEEIDGKMNITCAGMQPSCYPYVTWDNFHIGTSYNGKLRPVHVSGGIVLEPCTHTLRE